MEKNKPKTVNFELNGEMKKRTLELLDLQQNIKHISKVLKKEFSLSYSISNIEQGVENFKNSEYKLPLQQKYIELNNTNINSSDYTVTKDDIYGLVNSIQNLNREIRETKKFINNLNNEIKELKESINNEDSYNRHSTMKQHSSILTSDLIEIQNSKKEKKSYSINSKIKDLAVKRIYDKYNLEVKNESFAIEIALIESLSDDKIKDPQD